MQNNIWRRIGREMGVDALTLANLAELDAILILSKVALVTVSQDSRFKIFIHSNHLPWYIEDHKISTH